MDRRRYVPPSLEGPGIELDDREKATDRFYRGESARSTPGSGLGLSLVLAVARLHGGELRLEDNRPGLRAVLALPLDEDSRPKPRQGPAAAPITAEAMLGNLVLGGRSGMATAPADRSK